MEQRELCLGYGSAVEAWRRARRAVAACNPGDLLVRLLFGRAECVDVSPLPLPVARPIAPTHLAGSLLHVARTSLATGPGALHCVVSERRGRENYAATACHLCSGPYPEGSFCRVDDGLLVAGVPLTLLQLSGGLGDVALLELLSEFLGYFVPDGASPTGLRHSPPLVTVREIRDWLGAARRLRARDGLRMPRGSGRLLSLLDLAVERAASPGEMRASTLLSLPVERGGYGLPPARLNVITRLPDEVARAYGASAYVCDLTWEEHRLMAEYRGEEVHKQPGARLSDARKGNVLGHLGYEVLVIDKYQLGNVRLMDELARIAADRMGLEPPATDGPVLPARLALRRELLGGWASF